MICNPIQVSTIFDGTHCINIRLHPKQKWQYERAEIGYKVQYKNITLIIPGDMLRTFFNVEV